MALPKVIPTPAEIRSDQEKARRRFNLIKAMATMGYTVVPAVPYQKQTYYQWSKVSKHSYDFDILFKNESINDNCALLMEDTICCVDFDNHEAEPNGITVLRCLIKKYPEMFKGCIIEKTISGGYHAYFKGIQGNKYTVPFVINGIKMSVEVLCGRSLSYCWPTKTKNGMYEILSKSYFLNTLPKDLPALPKVFARPVIKKSAVIRRKATIYVNLSHAEKKLAVYYYLYVHQYIATARHDICRGMARYLAGIGLNEAEITEIAKQYILVHGRELTDDKEALRIAQYGLKKPLGLTDDALGFIKVYKMG